MTEGKLCVLGYRGLRHEKFFDLLDDAKVRVLLDVRRNPYSPNPDYTKKSLASASSDRPVKYYHLPQLGVPGAGASNIEEGAASTFEEQMETPEARAALAKIEKLLSKGANVALLCAEKDYRTCHRVKLVDMIRADLPGVELVELTGKPAKGLFDLPGL